MTVLDQRKETHPDDLRTLTRVQTGIILYQSQRLRQLKQQNARQAATVITLQRALGLLRERSNDVDE